MPEPQDDVTISADERLFHRIRPADIIVDPETQQLRPTSAAFRSKSNILSVDIASLTSPENVLKDYPTFSLVELGVRMLRSLQCKIVRDPLPNNQAHALVYGSAPNGRMTKPQAREIANAVGWLFNLTTKGF